MVQIENYVNSCNQNQCTIMNVDFISIIEMKKENKKYYRERKEKAHRNDGESTNKYYTKTKFYTHDVCGCMYKCRQFTNSN